MLLELYLSDTRTDFVKAVDLAMNDPHHFTRSLMETDMPLLIFFLESLDESIEANGD